MNTHTVIGAVTGLPQPADPRCVASAHAQAAALGSAESAWLPSLSLTGQEAREGTPVTTTVPTPRILLPAKKSC